MHQSRLQYTLLLTYFTMVCLPNLRVWPGLVRTPGRDPRQFTSLPIHHFLLFVANHLNRFFHSFGH